MARRDHLRVESYRVTPGRRADLKARDPDDTGEFKDHEQARPFLQRDLERLSVLQERLSAEGRRSLLVVLQAMDTGGKDGTVKHVFSGVNPAGCSVTRFRAPSPEELDHDFLWRVHHAAPRKGQIGIFNRSHYEDVLVVRVHGLAPEAAWKRRYAQINDFERLLTDSGTRILKFFLHISKKEQKERLRARLEDRDKRWKFNRTDLDERRLWGEYRKAYEDALTKCSTPWSSWHVVPANRKWFRNLVVARALVEALEEMDPRAPVPKLSASRIRIR